MNSSLEQLSDYRQKENFSIYKQKNNTPCDIIIIYNQNVMFASNFNSII